MRFGKSKQEAEQEPSRGGGGGGSFMRYLKDGDNVIRVLDEPSKWLYYWEHFNPDGNAFPCLSDDRENCPGCLSDNERMAKASRKVAMNAIHEYNGNDYVNVWKIPQTVADKLETRYDRLGTINDRDYMITRFKKSNGFYDYDVEGQDKEPRPYDPEQLKDPEELLAAAYEEAWGAPQSSSKVSNLSDRRDSLQAQIATEARNIRSNDAQAQEPQKSEEDEVMDEADLRKMDFWALVDLCSKEGLGRPEGSTPDEVVDWMMQTAPLK